MEIVYSEIAARWAAALLFVGFNLTFFPQFLLGYAGQPRRYHLYAPQFQFLHVCSTLGALALGLGYVLPAIYLTASALRGRKAGPNPWGAVGLEWQTPLALAIAATKMALVAWFFMSLKTSRGLTRLVAGAGLLWIVFFFVLAGLDFHFRATM